MATAAQIKDNLEIILSSLSSKYGREVGVKITKKNGLVYHAFDGKNIKEEAIDDLLQPVISSIYMTLTPLQKISAPLFIGQYKKNLENTILEIFKNEAKNHMIPESSFAVLIHDKNNPEMTSYNGVVSLGNIQINQYFN